MSTYIRCIDALDRVDRWATEPHPAPETLALRHACAALDDVLRAYPTLADRLEGDINDMCSAVGVEGP